MNVVTVVCDEGSTGALELPEAIVVRDACVRPDRLSEALDGADGLVLGLHPGRYAVAEVQRAVRASGIDPLGVQIVDIADPADGWGEDLALALRAAAARASTFQGSRPEHAKPVFPRTMSRRGFLSPHPEYLAVPAVDSDACQASDGCSICVAACPRSAYQIRDGRVRYDKDLCEPCGICVTACPVGAIENPAVTGAGIEAQVRSLTISGDRSSVLIFRCSRGAPALLGSDGFEIVVPCTGMVPAHWLIACLVLGAKQVVAVPCTASGCPLQHDELLLDGVDFARAVLGAVGCDAALVTHQHGEAVTGRSELPVSDLDRPFDPASAARVFQAIASLGPQRPAPISHDASPCGVVEIAPEACTMCSMCSRVCPTSALAERSAGEDIELVFDPGSCVACGQCVDVCPEVGRGAISLDRVIDFAELDRGARVVNTATVATCTVCGSPIAPDAMLERIGALLGHEQADTFSYLRERCQACRSL